mgnify:CR=1 FL=1
MGEAARLHSERRLARGAAAGARWATPSASPAAAVAGGTDPPVLPGPEIGDVLEGEFLRDAAGCAGDTGPAIQGRTPRDPEGSAATPSSMSQRSPFTMPMPARHGRTIRIPGNAGTRTPRAGRPRAFGTDTPGTARV